MSRRQLFIGVVLVFAIGTTIASAQHHGSQHDGPNSLHNTATLHWEGSPQGKAYSEFNHHLAGIFIMLIGLSELRGALATSIRVLQALAWTRFLLPLALVAAGIYLVGWSDHDAWPIGALSFTDTFSRDPEILQHKTYAALALSVGTIEMFRRMGKLRQPAWAVPLPLFAIVGGLLLFLHQHGDHPSAHKIAINHMVMGSMAIAAGSVKLALAPASAAPWRAVSVWLVAWPALILLIGLQLLFYTE